MQEPQQFKYDVFLSHSSKDKAVVRPLAERLRADGIKVWFDEWEIKPGDSIPAKIEVGLEYSRVLVLCMSANAFGSDWAQLESGTFRFRDPLNKERRFIPLRLDDATIKGSLAQFLYIDWCPVDREQEYKKLLEACKETGKSSGAIYGDFPFSSEAIHLSCNTPVTAFAFNNDLTRVLSSTADNFLRLWDVSTGSCLKVIRSHRKPILKIEWSTDERRILVWSPKETARLIDLQNDKIIADFGQSFLTKRQMDCLRLLAGGLTSREIQQHLRLDTMTVETHLNNLRKRLNVHKRNDVRQIVSQLYRVDARTEFPPLKADIKWLHLLALEIEQHRVLSKLSGRLSSLRLCLSGSDGSYQEEDGEYYFEGISGELASRGTRTKVSISAIAWKHDCRIAAAGFNEGAIKIWDVVSGKEIRILEGHTAKIESLSWHRGQRFLVSGSMDGTVKLWDAETGNCVFESKSRTKGKEHLAGVKRVAWHSSEERFAYGDQGGNIQVFLVGEQIADLKPSIQKRNLPEQVQYTNAKVLLVGESGVGKTGLSNYLAHGSKVEDDKPLPSTDGAWATHWALRHGKNKIGVDREIWLWDFAGQVDYRLVHQLYMDDTAAAVLVFNPQNENPFEGLGHWDRDLQKAARKPFAKLLAAARIDRGGLVVSSANMQKFMGERGFLGPLHETSAKTGKGCDQLREAIVQAIDWKCIPETTSPVLYHRLKQEILSLRDSGLVLIRLAELKQRMEMTLRGDHFELAELEAVVSLLVGPGMIQRLDFGGFILLRPEVLSRYAAAVVRKLRNHPQELGCILEDELLAGDLDYQDFKRLPREDEEVVLRTLLKTFISRAWCLRQPCDGTSLLTFPSYFRRERKEQTSHPSVLVTYRFDGPADDIYATLVVRLHHTVPFESTNLWKSAADFKTHTGKKLGFTLLRDGEGTSRLEVYFEPDVDGNSRVVFLRYVHDHLFQHAQNVVRLRRYYCQNQSCDSAKEPFSDQAKIDKALAPAGKGKVFCPDCGGQIVLRDVIEEKFESPAVKQQARKMEAEAQVVLDTESRELILVGHAFSIVAEAGQIYRGYTNSDHGIDGEIEFKDDRGQASGKRLYMQLKSGDSHLTTRQHDEAKIFQIKNPRWANYWQKQAYPLMLVIRTSDGEIRWMDVSAYLKHESASGKTVKQIVFEGERFDVMSVRQWRDRMLR